MAAPSYHKLPGSGIRRKGFFSAFAYRNTLWLGEDHILSVDRTPFSETYKRFYYRDVQAIVLQQTSRRGKLNLLACGLIFLTAQLFWFELRPITGLATFLIFIVLIFIAVNSFLGPTCRCRLWTAVQVEELAALQRLGPALRALLRITRRIATIQRRPRADEIAALAGPPAPPAGPGPAGPPEAPGPAGTAAEGPPAASGEAPPSTPSGEPAPAPGAEA